MLVANFSVPQKEGAPSISLQAQAGDAIFIVGPNGGGKSALLQRFVETISGDKFRYIVAHRQNWSASSSPDIAPSGRLATEQNIRNYSRGEQARWRDDYGPQRAGTQIAGLITAQNHWSRELAATCLRDNIAPAAYADKTPSPIDRLNHVLARGALTARITISPNEEIVAQHGEGTPFGFARLSDGERNAVLLCAEIIATSDPVVFLLDEPERHLHRSIIEPLLRALTADRSDCIFVIGTHEIELPIGFANARTLILRNCQWKNNLAASWDASLLEPDSSLPNDLRRAILGSRRKILFVEGTTASLDRSLFALLFPLVSVLPKGSCRHVIQAVAGLRGAEGTHWVHAVGLIDRDDRDDSEVAALSANGIVALPVTSIEAIYYGVIAREAVATRQAETLGRPKADIVDVAIKSALSELRRDTTKVHLVSCRCERLIRDQILEKIPTGRALAQMGDNISIQFNSPFAAETAHYKALLEANDLDGILSRYPARESGALNAIANGLRFSSRKDYEEAFLACVTKDEEIKRQLRALLGPLEVVLGAT